MISMPTDSLSDTKQSRNCLHLIISMEMLMSYASLWTINDKKSGRHLLRSISHLMDELVTFLKVSVYVNSTPLTF